MHNFDTLPHRAWCATVHLLCTAVAWRALFRVAPRARVLAAPEIRGRATVGVERGGGEERERKEKRVG